MQPLNRHLAVRVALVATLASPVAFDAKADAIIDWNMRSEAIITQSKLGTPPAIRVMAFVQTAAYEAVNAIAPSRPGAGLETDPARAISMDAAVAAAHRATLTKLIPAQRESIDAAYREALAQIPDGPAKRDGIAAGESAAQALLARRAEAADTNAPPYRPHAQPGVYIPTVTPAAPQWPQRTPWLMTHSAQFRPSPPPELTSERWYQDFEEVRAYGGKVSSKRTAEQTEIARFWEYSLPAVYFGVVRSAAAAPRRDIARNARLFAAVAQAMDDAMISVFDAKYHYNFWRPATAIRNGDRDGNDRTARDAAWAPFIDNPLHPEYPSAHSILASAVATVLQAEIGEGRAPELRTTSPTAQGVVRQWTSVEAFANEVAEARVYQGVHYRTSTEVGAVMGRQVGELAARKVLGRPATGGAPAQQAQSAVTAEYANRAAGSYDFPAVGTSTY